MKEPKSITRLELFLEVAKDGGGGEMPAPITRIEMFLAKIAGQNIVTPKPLTRVETFFARIAGEDVEIPSPITRKEMFLAKIAGEDIATPEPITRVELILGEWIEYGITAKSVTNELQPSADDAAATLIKAKSAQKKGVNE